MYVHRVEWKPDRNERCPARVNPVLRHAQERRLSLDGEWQFRLDPDDCDRAKGWFKDLRALRDIIRVPGCWQGQGFGDESTDTPWDFQLPARVFRATYKGTAWYAKRFAIPEAWRGSRVWLNFGGVHPSAEVWLNGIRLGAHSGPFVPFAFDVTKHVRAGGDNVVIVRVHEQNRWLGFAYNWSGCWSGLFRSVELTATGRSWIDRVWIHPDVDGERLILRVEVGGAARGALSFAVSASPIVRGRAAEATYELRGAGPHSFALPVRSPRLWSPDSPNLYRVNAALYRDGEVQDAMSERVGFLKLATEGKRFLINGEPYYMRGSGDFLAHPETGSPDTDRDRWRRKLATLRAYGYNYVRCQSYVPAPEYFDAADEVGLLVQSEMGMLGAWAGMDPWHSYAWPRPTATFREALKWQWDRTVMRDVNHPSAAIYCMSNELGQGTPFPETAWQCYRDTKAIKPSAFVIWTDGGFSPSLPSDFVNAEANVDQQAALPVIQHEFRWWSSYPDVRSKRKYRGAMRPYAIEKAEEAARLHGLHRLLGKMADVSQRLQYVEARGKMEACRRDNPRLAGICHFNAMDIGYSPQGIFDEFYERKLVSAETWRRTNGDTVIMMDRDFDDRILVADQTFRCRLSVSDFSHPPLERPTMEWQLLAGAKEIASGTVRYRHIPFCGCGAGTIRAELPRVSQPVALTLHTALREGKRAVRNEWSFWLFPIEPTGWLHAAGIDGSPTRTWIKGARSVRKVSANARSGQLPKVVLTEALDERLVRHCRAGGRVILAPPEWALRPFPGKLGQDAAYFFLPPANYPPLEDGHSGTIIRDHPMLGGFPHEGFADLQFFRLIRSAPPVHLEGLRLGKLDPVIRVLSTYFVGLPLAYLAEVAVGDGGIILCALDLDQKLPEARWLLAAMVRYAAGDRFGPRTMLPEEGLARLMGAT
jgi:beta-galactosidase